MSTPSAIAAVPAHVPPHLVHDFDLYRLAGATEDFHLALKALHDQGLPDVFWTPHNEGHWVVTRHADMMAIIADTSHFSSRMLVVPKSHNGSLPMYPIHADLPEHTSYRALLSATFSPKGVQALSDRARLVARRLIDELQPRGGCEFISDFAQHLPIEVFMSIVNVPASDREQLLEWADGMVRPKYAGAVAETFARILDYARNLIAERRARPGDDLVSTVIASQVFGRPLTDEELGGLVSLVLIGGMDTVASAMGFAAWFLARHPEHRRQLIDDPSLIGNAVDEILRRHSVVNLGRLVKQDVTVAGVRLQAGDMVIMPTPLGSMDERVFPAPLTVDFRRPNTTDYATFGKGPHRCPGANLGRAELRVFLEEWLPRIPDFRIADGAAVGMRSGVNGTIHTLPLTWN